MLGMLLVSLVESGRSNVTAADQLASGVPKAALSAGMSDGKRLDYLVDTFGA